MAELHERILSATQEPYESPNTKFDVSEVEERSMTLFEEAREDRTAGSVFNEKPNVEENSCEEPAADRTTLRFEHFVGRKPSSKDKLSPQFVAQQNAFHCGLCVLQ